MRMRHLFFLVGSLLLAAPGFAQVQLERKYKEGATYTAETSARFEQVLVIAGMNTDSSSDTRVVTTSTVGKRDGNGVLKIKDKIDSLQISTTAQGLQYAFDSANPDQAGNSPLEVLRPVHKILATRESTTVIGKDNKIQAIESDPNAFGSLSVEIQQLVKSQIDTEHLKQVANQENARLPSEPVKQGDTWTRTENVNFGAGQQMTFQTEYKYEGTIEKDGRQLDKITSKVLTVSYALQDSPLPLQLKSSDLKATESSGELLFDRMEGRFVSTSSKSRIQGDINFTLNNMDLPSKLDLKMSVSAADRPKS